MVFHNENRFKVGTTGFNYENKTKRRNKLIQLQWVEIPLLQELIPLASEAPKLFLQVVDLLVALAVILHLRGMADKLENGKK